MSKKSVDDGQTLGLKRWVDKHELYFGWISDKSRRLCHWIVTIPLHNCLSVASMWFAGNTAESLTSTKKVRPTSTGLGVKALFELNEKNCSTIGGYGWGHAGLFDQLLLKKFSESSFQPGG
jgi:hypothetical protein